jgi:hypothetical protein
MAALMKAYWDDGGRGTPNGAAKPVNLEEAKRIWIDEMGGVRGNFLGLIDDDEQTIQFYVDQTLPDNVEDARHLAMILVDFPRTELRGSYCRRVTVGEVCKLIEMAFDVGADHRHFGKLTFARW